MTRAVAWVVGVVVAFALGFALGREVGSGRSPDPAGPSPCAPRPAHQLIAYYFHPAERTEACVRAEALAQDAIRASFGAHLAAERIVWQTTSLDAEWNRDFVTRYGLTTSALVLVETYDGRETGHQVLDRLPALAGNERELREYVRQEVVAALERGETHTEE